MKKKIRYTDENMGDIKIIDDFLPKPEDLFLKEKTVKILKSKKHHLKKNKHAQQRDPN